MKSSFVLILPFLVALSATAQDFRFVSFADYYGGIEGEDGYENLRSRIFMEPRFSGGVEGGVEWVLSADLWVQPIGENESIDPWDILKEARLLIPFNNFDVTIGQKTVAYGFADVYGPLNVLHGTNRILLSLDDAFDQRKGDPLLQVRLYPSLESTVEFVYVPFTRRDGERQGPVPLPGSSDRVVWSNDPFIVDEPNSFVLSYSRYGEKFDLQLLYAWYTEQTPDFKVDETDAAVASTITPVYRKKHTLGVAYATRLGSTTLSQDFAFNLTNNFDGTDIGGQYSDLTVNTQVLTNLPFSVLAQFSIVYAYFFNFEGYEPGSDAAASAYLTEEIRNFHTQPFQHIAFVVSHFEKNFLREKLKTQLNVGFFFSPDIYLAPRFAYALTDYWTLETGADITLGDPPDYDLRRNPSNDNYYVRLLYRY